MFDLRTDDTSSGLVIKIFGDKTEILIDRQNEKEVMLALASRQLAKPFLLQFGNGIIYGFTPGDVCSREDIAKDEIRPLIARKLAQFHSVPLSDEQRQKGPCVIPLIRKFIALLEQHGEEHEKKG
ncbi:unnamed protein product [Rotaria sp. Silwood2]|nr:unnamed protein product [Rotaria sp. Silwood2]CAF3459569.1 unnamed protein product [Rotaria sp. Silwood2]CAF4405510.1 unnamed protein product [Rotaria sp. Silwood2]CAF4820560.1 unnamed protein product [Rotaria sp. Silwood2]